MNGFYLTYRPIASTNTYSYSITITIVILSIKALSSLSAHLQIGCLPSEDEPRGLKALMDSIIAVSYTHLDVYKRQVVF